MWYVAKTMITYLYNRFLQPNSGEKTFAQLLPKLALVWLPLLVVLLYMLIRYL